MDKISLAVKCTREEYMDFYATVRKKSMWSTVLGVILLITAGPLYVMDSEVTRYAPLFGLLALTLILLNPVILPAIRKGAAGRRYDNSDALQGALTVTIDRNELFVRSACQEGTVPLSALTDIWQTDKMTALVFGKELTVCIPMRTMTQEEAAAFQTILAAYKKEQL